MGYIREPEGVYFSIQSKPLTKDREKSLSEFIKRRKLEISSQFKKVKLTKQSV